MHYTTREIFAGVIRAIEPGNPFRDVLELEADTFDKKAFMKSLRSHFKIRDPNAIFNDLRTCVQLPSESAHAFCCRCVALKKKVQNMAESENIPFDMDNLKSTFFKTIYTGLRQTNIRNELRQSLIDARLSDEDLLLEVSEACAIEEERVKKFNGGSEKPAKVNQLTVESDSDEPDSHDSSSSEFSSSNSLNSHTHNQTQPSRKKSKAKKKGPAQNTAQSKTTSCTQNPHNPHTGPASSADINKLTAAFQEMAASNAKLTAEVNVLKELSGKPAPRTPTPRFRNPTPTTTAGTVLPSAPPMPAMNPYAPAFTTPAFTAPVRPRSNQRRALFRCANCEANNSPYCFHCLKCCAEGHRVNECPRN